MKSDNSKKEPFKEFYRHYSEACQSDKIKALYSQYARAGRDLIFNQILAKLSKLECYELELSKVNFCSFADNEITPYKVKEIIEFCIEIGLFNYDPELNTFWSIGILEQKLERLKDHKRQSDRKFDDWTKKKNLNDRINPKYKVEFQRITEMLARPIYTTVIPRYEKSENSDTTVIPSYLDKKIN